jgi:hypothetical protein
VASEAEWAQLNEKLLGIPGQARQLVREIVSGANWVLDQFWVPGRVKDWIRARLSDLGQLAEEAIYCLGEVAAGFMFPLTVLKASLDWGDLVKAPVGKAAGLISDEHLKVDDYWQGSAATAYSKASATQVGAATEFTGIVGDLQKHLAIFAAAGFGFYAAVVALFVTWINALAAAAAATAASGTTAAPAAIAAAAVATAALGKAAVAMIAAYSALAMDMVAAVEELEHRTTAKPFTAGWPAPVGSTIGPGGKDKWSKQK